MDTDTGFSDYPTAEEVEAFTATLSRVSVALDAAYMQFAKNFPEAAVWSRAQARPP